MSLETYLAPIRRWWSLIVVATVVAAATGLVLSFTIAPTYQSRTQLLVGPVNGDVDTIRAAGLLVQTFAELASSDQVLRAAVTEAGVDIDPTTLRERVRTTGDNVTRIVTIRVEIGDPTQAASLANTIGGALATLAASDTTRPEGQLRVVSVAQVDPAPVAPRPGLVVLLAGLAGLLGSIALVLVLERLSRALRTKDEIEALTQVPVLATLPAARRGHGVALAAEEDPTSPAAAAYRLLASRLDLDRPPDGETRLHLAGVGPRSAAGVVAANLAAAVASNRLPVTVIDGDPAGHAHAIIARAAAENSGGGIAPGIAVVVPQVGAPPTSHEDGLALATLGRLGTEARHALIVSGPVTYDPRDVSWAHAADRTVLIVEQDRTSRQDLEQALERLARAGVGMAGIVLAAPTRSQELRRLGSSAASDPGTPSPAADGGPGSIRDNQGRPRDLPGRAASVADAGADGTGGRVSG